MNQVIIHIDTTSREKTIIKLLIDEEEFIKEKENSRKNQTVLPLINDLLNEHRLSFNDLNEIEVNEGPGSFTGIRVGVSIANALSYVLHIPVNGKVSQNGSSPVEPVYAA